MGVKFSYQIINVKLCFRTINGRTLYHVIVPEGERFSWSDFTKLKDYLRTKFPNRFNKELYASGTPRWNEGGNVTYMKDQPVYEYNCTSKDIISEIESYAKNNLNLGDFELSFSSVDYDYISKLKEAPLEVKIQAGVTHTLN